METILTSAVVGATIGAIASITGFLIQVRLERRQRLGELVVIALEHFGGGSQNRSVGIAALRALRGDKRLWAQYRITAACLFVSQLRYLLAHGGNRWESHEIRNIEDMMSLLIEDDALRDASRDPGLREAMQRYERDWKNYARDAMKSDGSRERSKGGRPDEAAVAHLLTLIQEWLRRPDLGGAPKPSSSGERS